MVKSMLPINTVDKKPFWDMLSHFQPCYPVPSRKVFSDMIVPSIANTKEIIQTELLSGRYVSFTTDIWTESKTNYSFISVTAHWINAHWLRRDFVLDTPHFPGSHTAVRIAEKLQQVLVDWSLMGEGKPDGTDAQMVVRDGAKNMLAGCRNVPIDSIHCIIHLLQLVVKDAVFKDSGCARVVKKCRTLVAFLHHSARATSAFREKQVVMLGVHVTATKLLVGDVCTRWNSTFLMLRRIQLLEQAILCFQDDEVDLPAVISSWDESKSLDANDFFVISSIITVLEPFFHVTEVLSSNKVHCGMGVMQINWLRRELESVDNPRMQRLKQHLITQLKRRFYSSNPGESAGPNASVQYNIMTDPRYTIPALLHPAIKTTAITEQEARMKALTELREEMVKLAKKKQDEEDAKLRRKRAHEEQSSSQSQSQTKPTPQPTHQKRRCSMLDMIEEGSDDGKSSW